MKYPTAAEMDGGRVHGGRSPRERLERSYVVQPDGCWRWIRARTTSGYGHFWFAGEYYQAHRLVYTLLRGAVTTPSMDHLCRNRWCVNPDHVEPVSQRENSRRGIRTRLNPEKVLLVHEAVASGLSYRTVGRLFGIDHSTVCRVIKGQRWPEYLPKGEAA